MSEVGNKTPSSTNPTDLLRRSRSAESVILDPSFLASLPPSTTTTATNQLPKNQQQQQHQSSPSWTSCRMIGATKPKFSTPLCSRSTAAVVVNPSSATTEEGEKEPEQNSTPNLSSSSVVVISVPTTKANFPTIPAIPTIPTTTKMKRTQSAWKIGDGATGIPLSRADTQRLLASCGGDSNRGTVNVSGMGAIRVIIPEVGVTKTLPFSPAQSVESLRLSVTKGFILSETTTRYKLLLPVCMKSSKPRGLWLDSSRTLGTYSIGLDIDLRPLQLPSQQQQQQQGQGEKHLLSPPPSPPPTLVLEDCTKKGMDFTKIRSAFELQTINFTEEAKIGLWMDALGSWDSFSSSSKKKKLQKMTRAGIPSCLRGDVWTRLAELPDILSKNHSVYEQLVKKSEELRVDQAYTRKIRVDLSRSMPNHPFFACEGELGQRALSNVLHAFAVYDPEVGYTQGMNFIAATLLCHMSEENAFWMLVQLMRKYSMRGFFLNGVPLLLSTIETFNELVKRFLPELASHLETESIPVMAFAAPWFHTIFSGTEIPPNIIFRIWDMFFLEGQTFVFCTAIALLKLKKDKLLKLTCEDIMKEIHFQTWDANIGSALIETAVHVHRLTCMDPKKQNDQQQQQQTSSTTVDEDQLSIPAKVQTITRKPTIPNSTLQPKTIPTTTSTTNQSISPPNLQPSPLIVHQTSTIDTEEKPEVVVSTDILISPDESPELSS